MVRELPEYKCASLLDMAPQPVGLSLYSDP